MTAFELAGKLKLDSSEFTSSLGKQESAFKKFGNKISNTSKMISKIAKASVVAGTIMFTKSSIQEGLNFDKAMSQVAATLGKTTDEIQDLSKFAREMGAETAFSATEAAQALNYMALAGYDSEKSMKMLPTVLNLAAAGNIDLAKASDMVTDAQSALGLSIEQTEVMVDQMAKTSSKTNTSVEQLGDAFLTVGGTAKMMGKGSIDTTTELSMALGVLADNGIKGAEGGTMLRNILLSLSAPTDKAAKKLKELGVNVFDSNGDMRDLPFILEDINEATKDMTDQERTDFLSEVFNKRDLKAIEALLGTDKKRWTELLDEIGNAEGSAEKMAKTQLDNLAGDMTIFKSALSEAKLSISEKLTPSLRKFTQAGTIWVQRLTKAFNKDGLSGAIKEAGTLIRSTMASILGIDSDSSWLDIGKSIAGKIKTGIKNAFTKAKIKIADILGVEDSEHATWGDIAGKVVERLKAKFTDTKIKIADILGIEEPENATWGDIAGKVVGRIKGKISDVKLKIADILGVEDPEDATWGDIAGNITERIKGKIGDAKLKVADILGIEEPDSATWSDIGGKLIERIKYGVGSIKLKAADLLGIENPEDATWEDIGTKVIDGLAKHISNKGGFLKKLVLGDEYTDKSTWTDVGKKISGWLSLAFADGGILNAILGSGSEKLAAIITFAGDLLTGIAEWMSSNAGEVTRMAITLITSLAGAISQSAGPIITALGEVLGSPDLWKAIVNGLSDVSVALLDALFGTDLTNAIRRFFGVQIPGEIADASKDKVKAGWLNVMDRYMDDPSQKGQIAAEWNDFMRDVFNESGIDQSLYNEFMDTFSFDDMLDAFQNMNLEDFWSSLNNSLSSITSGTTKIQKLRKEAEDTAGEYDITFNINQNGSIPDISDGTDDGASHAKGLWSVPYDDYHAKLHRGEMVLTRSQARQFRDGNNSGIDIGGSVAEAVNAAMSKVFVMLNGEKVADLTTKRIRNNVNAISYNKLRSLGG